MKALSGILAALVKATCASSQSFNPPPCIVQKRAKSLPRELQPEARQLHARNPRSPFFSHLGWHCIREAAAGGLRSRPPARACKTGSAPFPPQGSVGPELDRPARWIRDRAELRRCCFQFEFRNCATSVPSHPDRWQRAALGQSEAAMEPERCDAVRRSNSRPEKSKRRSRSRVRSESDASDKLSATHAGRGSAGKMGGRDLGFDQGFRQVSN